MSITSVCTRASHVELSLSICLCSRFEHPFTFEFGFFLHLLLLFFFALNVSFYFKCYANSLVGPELLLPLALD